MKKNIIERERGDLSQSKMKPTVMTYDKFFLNGLIGLISWFLGAMDEVKMIE
ncbi:uncharacterized protein G2W53_041354 [Senna tora]|uniref:Uncharacterized protein n=1 Tax=Senna tora TaxID=362788 RepID=A0A834SH95_9FABA|nr:uncharacterized protein G2W53_041354 [Senna tora]